MLASNQSTLGIHVAPWMQGFTMMVMVLSILWTFIGWNTGTHDTKTENHGQGLNPFTITVIGLSSLLLCIGLIYLGLGVVKRGKSSHVMLLYGPLCLLIISATMSIVNTSTDRKKRGDAIGIITLILNLLTVFASVFIGASLIRASVPA